MMLTSELKIKEVRHNQFKEQISNLFDVVKVLKGKRTQTADLPHPTHMSGTFVF